MEINYVRVLVDVNFLHFTIRYKYFFFVFSVIFNTKFKHSNQIKALPPGK